MKFSFVGFDVGVTAKHAGERVGFPFDQPGKLPADYHNIFRIKILRNGKERHFTFYDSTHNYYEGKDELDEDGVTTAFYSIIADCSGEWHNFEDFCGEFGYDTDSRTAEKIYQAILKNKRKLYELGFTDDEIFTVYTYLDHKVNGGDDDRENT